VIPVTLAEKTFKQNGGTVAEEVHSLPLDKLREIFSADAALYITITRYGVKYLLLEPITGLCQCLFPERSEDVSGVAIIFVCDGPIQISFCHRHSNATGPATLGLFAKRLGFSPRQYNGGSREQHTVGYDNVWQYANHRFR
jgi:hypothetical protein